MPSYSTPGAYYERADAGAPAISPLRTDVAAFVGIARRGPLHVAVPIDSWRQFLAYFGPPTGAGYLAYVARAFFENGGRRCWIVRVSSDAAAAARLDVRLRGGAPGWRISASSEGVWGDALTIAVRETHRAQAMAFAGRSAAEFAQVDSVSGFERGTHVRVRIGPGVTVQRVVSLADAALRRLWWIHPDPTLRLPTEAPLPISDPSGNLPIESVEYTLVVREESRVVAVHDGLSLSTSHPRYGPAVAPGIAAPTPDGAPYSLPDAPPPIAIEELRSASDAAALVPLAPPDGWTALAGGADGLAALRVVDFVGDPSDPLATSDAGAPRPRGLAALARMDEPAVVAMPDIHIQPMPPPEHRPPPPCAPDPCLPPPPPGPAAPAPEPAGDLPPDCGDRDVESACLALVGHCEARRDRIALLDPPYAAAHDDRLGVGPIRAWRKLFDSKYAALYFPWAKVEEPPGSLVLLREVPPSGHVAGFFAATDLAVGVHKAPANGPLGWIQDVTVRVDDAAHALLNEEGIDAIRAFRGRGLRIFGARTVSSDPDWRYVNVRRLVMMIEKGLGVASRWAVFEPNDFRTRAKLHLSYTSFLVALWQRGALAGATADAAFFVRCDETNNPPDLRDQGDLVAEIGVAPSKPFEFVVLRVARAENALNIVEVDAREGVV